MATTATAPDAAPGGDRLRGDGPDHRRDRHDDRGEPELDRRPAEDLLGVLGEDERHAEAHRPQREEHEVAADQRPRPEHAPAAPAERRSATRCATKTAVRTAASASRPERLAVGPAGIRGLDDRVDQRHQRGRDRHRAGDVEAPLPGRRAALAQEHRAERGHRAGDGHVDEEDPLPAEAVGDRAADQPRRGPADGAGRAPDARAPCCARRPPGRSSSRSTARSAS